MRLATVATEGGTALGLVEGDSVRLARSAAPPDVLAFIRSPLAQDGFAEPPVPLASVRLLAPIPRPARNIVCVGRNFREHIEEGDRAWGRQGVSEACILFTKGTNTVAGPGDAITGHGLTKELDYECELAVVIGKGGRDIPAGDAYDHIFGYTILNDVTARDLQQAHRQWFKGKSLDGFCPMGPVVVTKDEVPWPLQLDMRLLVNGEVRQRMNTRDMLWDVPAIIEVLSAGHSLEPGDIIATGTGPGCGFAFDPPRFLQPGDVVRAEIDGIGVLENPVV